MNTIYCSGCGNAMMSSMRLCPNCGSKAHSPTPPSISPIQGQTPFAPPNSQVTGGNAPAVHGVVPGVRGWLLILCVSLVFLTPLIILGGLAREWNESQQLLDVPNFREALFFETAVYLFFGLYSVFVGVQLWSVKPHAVTNAKRFVIAQAIIAIALPAALAAMLGVSFIDVDGIRSAVHGLIYLAVWYPYLLKSKRVKATYP